MIAIKSILNRILNDMKTTTDINALKQTAIVLISKSDIKDRDKMLSEIYKINTLQDLQKYLYNALLKFEGLGVIKDK